MRKHTSTQDNTINNTKPTIYHVVISHFPLFICFLATVLLTNKQAIPPLILLRHCFMAHLVIDAVFHSMNVRCLFLCLPDPGWSGPSLCSVCWAWPGPLAWCMSTRAPWSWPTCSPSLTPFKECSSSSFTVSCRKRYGSYTADGFPLCLQDLV